ncbi:MAG: ImmA/IrrE family metallo-endopeptidase [Candidatus Paceibacterota bacterium]|jgi:hypothetical protein
MKTPFLGNFKDIEIISLEVLKIFHKKIKNYKKLSKKDFLFKIIKSMGGEIRTNQSADPYPIYAPLVIEPDKRFTITRSQYTTFFEDNFIIATNIGRIFLNYKEDKRETKRKTVFWHLEKEIDWASYYFALVFLTPEQEFRKIFNEHKKTSVFMQNSILSGYFEVSIKKIIERKEKLHLK